MGWEFGKYTCPLYDGDIDYRRVVEILKKVGYTNDVCVEDESLSHFPKAEHASILQREIQYLKKLR